MTRILKLGSSVGVAQIKRDYIMTILSLEELQKHYGSADAYVRRLVSFISSPAGKTVSFISTGRLSGAEEVKEWWLRFPRLRELLLIDGPAACAQADELWSRGAVQNAYELQPTPELIHCIADGDTEKIIDLVAKSEQTALAMPLEPSLVLNYIKKLCFEIHRLITELNGNPSNVDELLLLCRNDLKGVCIRDIFTILKNAAVATAEYLAGLDKIRPSTRMRHIQQDLMQSFTKDITIRELASRHGISPAYLGQLFKQEYGESFKDYRNRLRIEEAARLLRKTDLRIYEIAGHVGYHSTDYFERRFQSFYGTTPSAYRAELSGGR
jgi:two-component system response regulator YesN